MDGDKLNKIPTLYKIRDCSYMIKNHFATVPCFGGIYDKRVRDNTLSVLYICILSK